VALTLFGIATADGGGENFLLMKKTASRAELN
jgi:hypothetical protein